MQAAKQAGIVDRDPVRIAEEVRAGLVEKRDRYKQQMDMIARLVGIMDEAILEEDKHIMELKNG